ncbi:hypothetical protein ABIS02_36975 [Paraburkholderia fungorum]
MRGIYSGRATHRRRIASGKGILDGLVDFLLGFIYARTMFLQGLIFTGGLPGIVRLVSTRRHDELLLRGILVRRANGVPPGASSAALTRKRSLDVPAKLPKQRDKRREACAVQQVDDRISGDCNARPQGP